MSSLEKRPLKVAIAGGSLGGLCAGIALHGIGCDVNVFERTAGPMTSRGAGIVVQPDLLALMASGGAPTLPTTMCLHRQYLDPDGGRRLMPAPQQFTSWDAIYQTLLAAFPSDRYHQDHRLTGFDQSVETATARFAGRDDVTADLLVCADGSRSASRDTLIKPPRVPTYAGYFAWRGTIEESDAPSDLAQFFVDRFSFCDARSGGHILAYFIPGANASAKVGERRINWVWYVHAPEGPELDDLLTDKDGQRRDGSVPPGMARLSAIDGLYTRASAQLHPRFAELVRSTREPFIQVIQDFAVEQMVFGRVLLLGDAAFIVRPHTAAATAKAAADAMELAASLMRRDRVSDALADWQRSRVAAGLSLTDYGIALGERTAALRPATTPSDP
ncbi:MAG TPA: FAD-dependent monooxygenase [Tepidisphaeraceae bacterium]|jgi:2-polyprenyl-6-methoxyphenol hydroxylase-like FAD-dependent oxidoreductase